MNKKERREYNKKWRERNRAKGLCLFCTEKAIEGKSCCQKHIDYKKKEKYKESARKYSSNLRKIRLKQGLCVVCGNKNHRENKTTCVKCGKKVSKTVMKSRKH